MFFFCKSCTFTVSTAKCLNFSIFGQKRKSTYDHRELTLTEFQSMAINILNLNNTLAEVEQKFHEIDKDKNGKLSTREFVDYFLTDLADNEERFKEDYLNFGLDTERNSFEHGLLLFEAMDGLKSQSNSVGT